MANDGYPKERTALLFIEPYNDFLSEGGKLWPMVEGVAKSAACGSGKLLRAKSFWTEGRAGPLTIPRTASDKDAAQRLWEVSEKLTGVQWLAEERSRTASLMR